MANVMNFPLRFKAAGTHLCLTALVAVMAAALVFGLWYPWPYRAISGGQSLFILIISVDLVLGPALTFVAFNPSKAKSVLVRDLMVIAALQLGGLAYGLHTVFQARPVALVYEPGRFRVVTTVDLRYDELPEALPELRTLSLTGPKLLGVREPRNSSENSNAIEMALQGMDIGQRPSYWQPYNLSLQSIVKEARPLSVLYEQYPGSRQEIEKYLKENGKQPAAVKFLPIIAKESSWSALVDGQTGEFIGFVPYDGFI